jgi:hypothetical protein
MNRLIAVITGLHVLAHGIFGCCGDHGTHVAHASHACHTVDRHGCGEHGEHYEHATCGGDASLVCIADPSGGLPHQCPHASCQWLDTKPACTDELFKLKLNRNELGCLDVRTESSPANAGISCLDDCYSRPAALPLRLHLAVGVLLI